MTVLNYKKPAFWLILAAVAVCAAFAVCFLTSPRFGKTSFLDLNHNGIEEELRLVEMGYSQLIVIYENGEQIFCEDGASSVETRWNELFLCTLEGKDYLLRYNQVMNKRMIQGSCVYSYELFSLENGQENIIRSNEVVFDLNFGLPLHEWEGGFAPDAIAAFMEEVNWYLAHSRQLLNTNEDLLEAFERTGRLEDDLSFLEHEIKGHKYVRDNTKSLLENLRGFKVLMETEIQH